MAGIDSLSFKYRAHFINSRPSQQLQLEVPQLKLLHMGAQKRKITRPIVHKTWTIELMLNRYILVALQTYDSSPIVYFNFQLFKKNSETQKWHTTHTVTLRLAEIELIPFQGIIENSLDFVMYPMNNAIPSHQKDLEYFNYLMDIQELTVNVRRNLRIAFKTYDNSSFIFFKVFLCQMGEWQFHQDINFALPEFLVLKEILTEAILAYRTPVQTPVQTNTLDTNLVSNQDPSTLVTQHGTAFNTILDTSEGQEKIIGPKEPSKRKPLRCARHFKINCIDSAAVRFT